MAEPTPGPWQWYWNEENNEAVCGVFHESRPGHAYSVARCPRYQKREKWEADARLIAAAPLMYEFIKRKANGGDGEAIKILETIRADDARGINRETRGIYG